MEDQIDLDVDNLFNGDTGLDEGALGDILPGANHPALQPQTVAPSAALVKRILNLKYCGCLKRVAWGKQGHVTAISDDNTTVTVQCLRLIPGTSRWQLTSAKPLGQLFDDASSLSWSPMGVDLAVVDSKARVYFYTMTTTCLNRLNENKHTLAVPPEEHSQPILTFWLNQDRPDRGPRNVVLSLVKDNEQWSQNLGKSKSFGPQFQRAFLLVTKKGTLALTYQALDGQYHRVSIQLSLPTGTSLAHGAIAATSEGKLVLALYSFEDRLSLHSVHIEWPVEWKVNPADPARPKITAKLVNIDIPTSSTSAEMGDAGMDQPFQTSKLVLTHLEILPTSDIENSVQISPQIWAVFALIDSSVSAIEPGYLLSSVIKRWNVTPIHHKLHPIFDEMATKSENHSSSQDTIAVDKMPDTQFPQIITNLELIDNGQQMMITTIDGQVELWNSINMTPASFDSDPNLVTSMTQSGFSFSPSTASVIVTISPNTASSITQRADLVSFMGEALYLGQPSKGLDMADPQQSAAASALILAFSRACYSSSNSDDVLTSICTAYRQELPTALVARLYSVMFQTTEFIHERAPNSQIDRMIQRPLAQKALSLHLALYLSGRQSLQLDGFPHPSTWAYLWVWITLNLRYIYTSIILLFKEIQAIQQNPQAPLLAPSYVEMVCNMLKYTFDIYRFIFETIFEVGDRQSNPDMFDNPASAPYFNLGDEKGDGSQGLVALLINCNWSRSALLSIVQPMLYFVRQADPSNPNVRKIVDAIRRYSSGKGLSLSAVELLFNARWYQRVGLAEKEQFDSNVIAARQIEMMTTGRVSVHYQNTVQFLLTNVMNNEKGLRNRQPPEISRLKLFTDTPDVSWLLLNMDQHIPTPPTVKDNSSSVRKLYDVHKKSAILVDNQTSELHPITDATSEATSHTKTEGEGQMIRRCTRCGSLSEDIHGTRADWPKALSTAFAARCVCDGFWVLEPLHTNEIAMDRKINPQANSAADIDDTNPLNETQ